MNDEQGSERRVQIEARGLSRRYDRGGQAVDALVDVDLDIGAGEFLVVSGRSGSGKTTLLNLLGGLDRPTAGSVRVGERSLESVSLETMSESALAAWRASRVGFVFQGFRLVEGLDVADNVAVPLFLAGRLGERDRIRGLLETLELSSRAEHFPAELSHGECQRVAIARAFVLDPEIILVDEPTGSLDRESAGAVCEILAARAREHGTTIVCATHDPELAASADRRVELRYGRLT